ncbi:vWA domain-containing protein [Ilumatobacter nonamiensis]|uniref:vWA domain-containing protein n=1 Tax=Ilumatobacter nonamiensis TaxID=467093 RepID=UPI000684E309|nr:VWA domain-containing protein [Ilumatobacter nonamiensis]
MGGRHRSALVLAHPTLATAGRRSVGARNIVLGREVTRHDLVAGVDRALFTATYAARLRDAGVDVGFNSVERCAASLDAVGPLTLDDAYWVLRLSLVTRYEDLAVFDAVFETVFDSVLHVEMGWVSPRSSPRPPPEGTDDDVLVRARRAHDPGAPRATALPWATLPTTGDEDDLDDAGSDDHLAIPDLLPTTDTGILDRPFDLLDDAELEQLADLLTSSATVWPERRSRRRRPTHGGGRTALRRSMRLAMRTGGDVMTLVHDRPQRRPRPVVVLLDVSGSMERYARAYLHLVRPLAMVHRAEVFAFATELTRVTAAMRVRSTADVIDHMNESVGDRFGGTRIAHSLRALLRHRSWSTSTRGAVVLICSDGWETDDPAELERVMRRLALLAHRIVWVNPRAAATEFEPLAGGMSAALPHCDRFLAGNTARSMAEVIAAMTEPTSA